MVVTTSVQFFESLYANHSCRMPQTATEFLNSVILFDEVQTFPARLFEAY